MSEIEVPTEHLHESIHEELHKHGHATDPWIGRVALTAALLAVLAAVAALLAGHQVNEAMIEQMRASDQWAFFQSKGIKQSVLQAKVDVLTSLGKPIAEQDKKKLEYYDHDKDKIQETAEEHQKDSDVHLQRHNGLAKSVTVLQVAIALSAIAVLTKRRSLWLGSVVLGGIACVFMGQALL